MASGPPSGSFLQGPGIPSAGPPPGGMMQGIANASNPYRSSVAKGRRNMYQATNFLQGSSAASSQPQNTNLMAAMPPVPTSQPPAVPAPQMLDQSKNPGIGTEFRPIIPHRPFGDQPEAQIHAAPAFSGSQPSSLDGSNQFSPSSLQRSNNSAFHNLNEPSPVSGILQQGGAWNQTYQNHSSLPQTQHVEAKKAEMKIPSQMPNAINYGQDGNTFATGMEEQFSQLSLNSPQSTNNNPSSQYYQPSGQFNPPNMLYSNLPQHPRSLPSQTIPPPDRHSVNNRQSNTFHGQTENTSHNSVMAAFDVATDNSVGGNFVMPTHSRQQNSFSNSAPSSSISSFNPSMNSNITNKQGGQPNANPVLDAFQTGNGKAFDGFSGNNRQEKALPSTQFDEISLNHDEPPKFAVQPQYNAPPSHQDLSQVPAAFGISAMTQKPVMHYDMQKTHPTGSEMNHGLVNNEQDGESSSDVESDIDSEEQTSSNGDVTDDEYSGVDNSEGADHSAAYQYTAQQMQWKGQQPGENMYGQQRESMPIQRHQPGVAPGQERTVPNVQGQGVTHLQPTEPMQPSNSGNDVSQLFGQSASSTDWFVTAQKSSNSSDVAPGSHFKPTPSDSQMEMVVGRVVSSDIGLDQGFLKVDSEGHALPSSNVPSAQSFGLTPSTGLSEENLSNGWVNVQPSQSDQRSVVTESVFGVQQPVLHESPNVQLDASPMKVMAGMDIADAAKAGQITNEEPEIRSFQGENGQPGFGIPTILQGVSLGQTQANPISESSPRINAQQVISSFDVGAIFPSAPVGMGTAPSVSTGLTQPLLPQLNNEALPGTTAEPSAFMQQSTAPGQPHSGAPSVTSGSVFPPKQSLAAFSPMLPKSVAQQNIGSHEVAKAERPQHSTNTHSQQNYVSPSQMGHHVEPTDVDRAFTGNFHDPSSSKSSSETMKSNPLASRGQTNTVFVPRLPAAAKSRTDVKAALPAAKRKQQELGCTVPAADQTHPDLHSVGSNYEGAIGRGTGADTGDLFPTSRNSDALLLSSKENPSSLPNTPNFVSSASDGSLSHHLNASSDTLPSFSPSGSRLLPSNSGKNFPLVQNMSSSTTSSATSVVENVINNQTPLNPMDDVRVHPSKMVNMQTSPNVERASLPSQVENTGFLSGAGNFNLPNALGSPNLSNDISAEYAQMSTMQSMKNEVPSSMPQHFISSRPAPDLHQKSPQTSQPSAAMMTFQLGSVMVSQSETSPQQNVPVAAQQSRASFAQEITQQDTSQVKPISAFPAELGATPSTQLNHSLVGHQNSSFVRQQITAPVAQQNPASVIRPNAGSLTEQNTSLAAQQGQTSLPPQDTAFMRRQSSATMSKQNSQFAAQQISAMQNATLAAQQDNTSVAQQNPVLAGQHSNASIAQQIPVVAGQHSNASMAQQNPVLAAQHSNASIGQQNPVLAAQHSNASLAQQNPLLAAQQSNASVTQQNPVLVGQQSDASIAQQNAALAAQQSSASIAQQNAAFAAQLSPALGGQQNLALSMQHDLAASPAQAVSHGQGLDQFGGQQMFNQGQVALQDPSSFQGSVQSGPASLTQPMYGAPSQSFGPQASMDYMAQAQQMGPQSMGMNPFGGQYPNPYGGAYGNLPPQMYNNYWMGGMQPNAMMPGYYDWYYGQWANYYQYGDYMAQQQQQQQWETMSEQSGNYSYQSSQQVSEVDLDSRPTSALAAALAEHVTSYTEDIGQPEFFKPETPPPMERLTPLHFNRPHVIARCDCPGVTLIADPSQPADGIPAVVHRIPLGQMLPPTDLSDFPGPLIVGETSKKSIVSFARKKAAEVLNSDVHEGRAKALLWEYSALLVQRNGALDGTDVADLLMQKSFTTPFSQAGDLRYPGKEEVDTYRGLMLQGAKRDAINYAIREGLWGHAFTLAFMGDPRSVKLLIAKFLSTVDAQDPLTTLYSHLGNKGAASFPYIVKGNADWIQHLCMILSNPSPDKESDAKGIVALGDSLGQDSQTAGAHLCYLTAGMLPRNHKETRTKMALISQDHRGQSGRSDLWAHNDAIQLTEIFEFALRLQSKDSYIVPFQHFKCVYAMRLIGCGMVAEGFAYLQAIAEAVLLRPSSYSADLIATVLKLAQNVSLLQASSLDDIPDWLTDLQNILDGNEGRALDTARSASVQSEPDSARSSHKPTPIQYESQSSSASSDQVETDSNTSGGHFVPPDVPSAAPYRESDYHQSYETGSLYDSASLPGAEPTVEGYQTGLQHPVQPGYPQFDPNAYPQLPTAGQEPAPYLGYNENQTVYTQNEPDVSYGHPYGMDYGQAPSSYSPEHAHSVPQGVSPPTAEEPQPDEEDLFEAFKNKNKRKAGQDVDSETNDSASTTSSPAKDGKDSSADPSSQKKGWLSGVFSKVFGASKEIHLPDSKMKLYFDKEKNKWVDPDESEETKDLPPPPPTMQYKGPTSAPNPPGPMVPKMPAMPKMPTMPAMPSSNSATSSSAPTTLLAQAATAPANTMAAPTGFSPAVPAIPQASAVAPASVHTPVSNSRPNELPAGTGDEPQEPAPPPSIFSRKAHGFGRRGPRYVNTMGNAKPATNSATLPGLFDPMAMNTAAPTNFFVPSQPAPSAD